MRRSAIVATSVFFAIALASISPVVSQRSGTITTLKHIQVDSKTITTLSATKKYVVDLTQRGVKYEFESEIDFSRVVVRTTRGAVALNTFLDKIFPKAETNVSDSPQSLILGTAPTGTRQTRTSATLSRALNFTCNADICTCRGKADCIDLIFDSPFCRGPIGCRQDPTHGTVCNCNRTP